MDVSCQIGDVIRNEVDFDQLITKLVTVVQETMQPSHVSLWLCPLEQPQPRNTRVLPRIEVIESEEN